MSNLHRFRLAGFEGSKKGSGGPGLPELDGGLREVREAIKDLMALPRAQREAQLERIGGEMELMIERLRPLGEQAGKRLQLAREILALLEQVSKMQ